LKKKKKKKDWACCCLKEREASPVGAGKAKAQFEQETGHKISEGWRESKPTAGGFS